MAGLSTLAINEYYLRRYEKKHISFDFIPEGSEDPIPNTPKFKLEVCARHLVKIETVGDETMKIIV